MPYHPAFICSGGLQMLIMSVLLVVIASGTHGWVQVSYLPVGWHARTKTIVSLKTCSLSDTEGGICISVIQVSGHVGGLQKQSNYFGYCLRLSHLVAIRTIVLVGHHPPCFRGGSYWRGHWTEGSRCREQEVTHHEDMVQVPTSLPSGQNTTVLSRFKVIYC
jgi:hypothetical protein